MTLGIEQTTLSIYNVYRHEIYFKHQGRTYNPALPPVISIHGDWSLFFSIKGIFERGLWYEKQAKVSPSSCIGTGSWIQRDLWGNGGQNPDEWGFENY